MPGSGRARPDELASQVTASLALAGYVGAVYAVVVVGAGALLGRGRPDLALSVAATTVVAVTFEPAREASRRLAGRLVYGRRATPYQALARLSKQASRAYPTDEVLPEMAKVLADGLGASRSQVWLRVGESLRLAAAWPRVPTGAERPLPLVAGELPEVPGADHAVPVHRQGELLGALAVARPATEPLTPVERRLLDDLAAQAGLALRNVRLTAELDQRMAESSARAAELRASRARVVAAQDAERRRLERDLHDGAQQHLVALTAQLGLARLLAGRAPERARALLVRLGAGAEQAQRDLAAFASGVYPSRLAAEGLVAALQARAEALALPVAVRARGLGRHPPEVEAAVYFCCLEALQNVVKHGAAGAALVRLEEDGRGLRFSVEDDGAGFDPARAGGGAGLCNMADRLQALGGALTVRSAAGRGTAVSGWLPARRPEPVP
jgi:signal transduction histidine kinase